MQSEIGRTRESSNKNEKLLSQHSKQYTRHNHEVTAILRAGPTENGKSDESSLLFDFFQGTIQGAL